MANVLHILDVAGVSSILSYFYNKLERGKSDLIYHEKNSFSSSISRFYHGKSFRKYKMLLLKGFFKSFHYQIIHIHRAEVLVPLFKISGKKIILHYHGSDINEKNRSRNKMRIFCRSMADLIIYNGKKMEPYIITNKPVKKLFLPNPVDIEHFCLKDNKKRNGKLIFVSSNLDKDKTIEVASNLGQVDVIDLDKQQIPYSNMPEFLSKYELYIDIKIMPWGYTLPDMSTTALQALACGCKVYHDGKIIERLPEEFLPVNVINRLDQYYQDILKN